MNSRDNDSGATWVFTLLFALAICLMVATAVGGLFIWQRQQAIQLSAMVQRERAMAEQNLALRSAEQAQTQLQGILREESVAELESIPSEASGAIELDANANGSDEPSRLELVIVESLQQQLDAMVADDLERLMQCFSVSSRVKLVWNGKVRSGEAWASQLLTDQEASSFEGLSLADVLVERVSNSNLLATSAWKRDEQVQFRSTTLFVLENKSWKIRYQSTSSVAPN